LESKENLTERENRKKERLAVKFWFRFWIYYWNRGRPCQPFLYLYNL